MLGIHYAEGFFIPPGYKFKPTGEELLKNYLLPAIHHQELPCNILFEFQIYGDAEPWKVFGEEGNVDLWVLTQVKKRGNSKMDRTCGCGTWKGQYNNPIKDSHDNIIGTNRYFSFDCKDKSQLKGNWTMHEYALEGYKHEYAICHIKNNQDMINRSNLCEVKLKERKEIMSWVVCKEGFRIPPGYTFDPTDQEVLLYYLLPSIYEQELPCNILQKINIYEEGVEQLMMLGLKEAWVLTQVMNRSQSRMGRRVGSGTWKGQNNLPIYDGQGNEIGRKRYFCFESQSNGNWGMHEYSFSKYETNYTICHIEETKKQKLKRKTMHMQCEGVSPKRLCWSVADNQISYQEDWSNYQEQGNDCVQLAYEQEYDVEAEMQNLMWSCFQEQEQLQLGDDSVALALPQEYDNGDGGATALMQNQDLVVIEVDPIGMSMDDLLGQENESEKPQGVGEESLGQKDDDLKEIFDEIEASALSPEFQLSNVH